MADSVDIDLYADVEEFPQEELEAASNDLFDDVLSTSKDEKDEKKDDADAPGSTPITAPGTASSAPPPRRYQLYVGNLTWWTSDQDIQDAVQDQGVADFIDVKFYENKINGQSKGFCCVSVGSEASTRIIMEKLPKKELHGQTPVVTYASRQALQQFESQSKTRGPQQQPPSRSGPPPRMPMGRGPPPGFNRPPPGMPHMRGPPPMHAGPPPAIPPPAMGGPPPGMHLRGPPPGPVPHFNPAFVPGGPPAGYPPAVPHGLSDTEFEEIMGRNRTVSSSAIARAVQDAANGE